MFLAIDPGLNNCGVCMYTFTDNSFTAISTLLIANQRKFTDSEKEIEKRYDARTVKILNTCNKISSLIQSNEIETVVIEAPFYNSLTPAAFGSLLEVIYSLKYKVIYPENISLQFIEPLTIKKMFTTKSLASKDLMKSFLLSKILSSEIVLSDTINVDNLSEHEIDAIAIGFCHYLLLRKG